MLPEEHHSLDDCCDLFVLSKFVPVVDEVEHSPVNIVVSLQLPVFLLLHSVPGVVFTEQSPGLLDIPSQWSLYQTPGIPDRHVIAFNFSCFPRTNLKANITEAEPSVVPDEKS